ncbi:MAG: replicative DNA helicase, partial [Selenomonadaceae bacterium]|nr:replicative DNA helicase [Selenomonadaceae bacterium]
EGGIDSQRLRTGKLEDEEWERLIHTADKLSKAKIYIDDTPGITVMELRSKARRLKAEHGLDLVIIDYLQLMQGRVSRGGDNRQQEISEISRSLKALARELNVPVVALSQLSRGVESRQVKKPMLSDLRESGSLEQDADIVMFLYREDYYDQDTENKNITEVIIAKHRNGAIGTVSLFFQKEFTKFRDLSRMA